MFQATNINKLKSNRNKKDGKFLVYRLFYLKKSLKLGQESQKNTCCDCTTNNSGHIWTHGVHQQVICLVVF